MNMSCNVGHMDPTSPRNLVALYMLTSSCTQSWLTLATESSPRHANHNLTQVALQLSAAEKHGSTGMHIPLHCTDISEKCNCRHCPACAHVTQ